MSVSGRRSKRRAGVGCGSPVKVRMATGNFRLLSRNRPAPRRHLRSTFSRIDTRLGSSKEDGHGGTYCTSVTPPDAFVLEPIMSTKALNSATFETVFVVGAVQDVQRRMLFAAFVGKFREV
jgi:hypothetical protein